MPANDRPWDKRNRDDSGGDEERPRPRRRRDEDAESDEDSRDRPRRRDDFEDDNDERDRPRRRPKPEPSNGLAVAGLILGLLSFCTAGIAGLPGLVCSFLALSKPTGRGMAIAGLVLSGLGTLAGIGLAVLAFVSVGSARERQKDANNMKQIGLALHGYHDANAHFAAPYARGWGAPDGVNRELSWRVGMLPYIEQASLSSQFDMSQPWDSPKNRPLSNTAISTYTSPYGAERASTQTPYRVFYGGGAMFNEDGKPVRFTDILDGTSNTIMVAHAAEQVPWAEPRELKYDPNGPLPPLWAKDIKTTQVLLADGSVRVINRTISERTLRAAITRSGGETLDLDW